MQLTKEFKEEFGLYKQSLLDDSDKRNKLHHCPLCNTSVADRTVSLYKELIDALYRVYKWCGEKETHEFETKDIKHLLGKNEYARFGDLVRFEGKIYKPKNAEGKTRKALYGMNMERAKEFFNGERKIPLQIVINQMTNEMIESHYVYIDAFPELHQLLTREGMYDSQKKMF